MCIMYSLDGTLPSFASTTRPIMSMTTISLSSIPRLSTPDGVRQMRPVVLSSALKFPERCLQRPIASASFAARTTAFFTFPSNIVAPRLHFINAHV